jgi:tight adherence protein C
MNPSTRVADFNLEDWLPAGVSPDAVIAALAALTVLVALYAVWLALRPRNPYQRRFADIAERKDTLRRAALGPARRQRQPATEGLMSTVVQRLNLMRSSHATDARLLLAQAGMRSRDAMIKYLFARFSMPSLFGFIVLADGFTLQLLPIPENLVMLAALAAAGIGYIAPGYYLKNVAQKRAKKMTLALPDALDLLVICAEAGLSLDSSLSRVARELEPSFPELGEELGLTAVELTFMPDRRQAFENLNARTNMPGIRGVVNTLLQTARYGTPLAQSLRVLAAEFREARITRAEEKAARLPAMMTVPMILFILPTLFIVLMGPAALGIIDTFSGKGKQQDVTVVEHSNGGGDTDAGPESGNVTYVQANDAAEKQTQAAKLLLKPSKARLKIVEPVVIDLDARPLSSGLQHRVAVVAADTPDNDPAALRNSVPVQAAQGRVVLPAAAAGANEARLYYIPQFHTAYVAAARAPIQVDAGAQDAIQASHLLRDATFGRSKFDAMYAGRSLTIEGQLLRAEPRSAAEISAIPALRTVVAGANAYMALSIGWTEPWASSDGAPSEVQCVIPADDSAVRQRVAALKPGAPVVVQGSPADWSAMPGGTAIVLGSCKLSP